MPEPLNKSYIDQFNQWEQRGRGCSVFDEPVDIEPVFKPFFFYILSRQQAAAIQHHQPVFNRLLLFFKGTRSKPGKVAYHTAAEYTGEAFAASGMPSLHCLTVAWTKGQISAGHEAGYLVQALAVCSYPVSFEIIAAGEAITIQFTCYRPDVLHLKNQLHACGLRCMEAAQEDALLPLLEGMPEITDFCLHEPFVRPVAMYNKPGTDPFVRLFEVLGNLRQGEQAAIQVLFKPAANDWGESILRSVTTKDEKSIFEKMPDMLAQARLKTAAPPLYAVVIRAVVRGADDGATNHLARKIEQDIVQMSASAGNRLKACSNKHYHPVIHKDDVLLRQTHRLGMLLNSRELATFVHMPSAQIIIAKPHLYATTLLKEKNTRS